MGGDVSRYVPPFAGEADSPYFQSFNRGKRSLTLNLRHPDGQAVLHDLVRVSDAVFNNARGDLPGKLGLTYEALKAINPARRLLLAHRLRHHRAARRRAGLRLPDPGLRRVHVGDGRARRPAREVRRIGHRLRGRLRRHDRPHGGPLRRAAHRGGPRRRHLPPRHRGEHALLLRHLDAQPRLGRRSATRDSAPPGPRPRAELPHAATAGSSSSATRTSSGRSSWRPWTPPELGRDPRFATFADRHVQPGDASAPAQGTLRRRARRRTGSTGCAGACPAPPSTTCARPSPTSRCWRAT